MTRSKAALRRYALAAACIGLAVLLHRSPIGPLFYPMGLFILAVVAAAWFGGPGPGVFAAGLSALALPHVMAAPYGFFDLPRFLTLGVAGLAVGWGTRSRARAGAAHLAASEDRYERAMEATAAGHWEWDLVTNQVFYSARFRELYGIPMEEKFADRDAWKARQRVSAPDRELQEAALQAAVADPAKRYDIELSIEPRPGEVRWLRSRGKVFRAADGRPLRFSGTLMDVTAQKLAEEALRESEKRYERVMLSANAGFWDWDVANDRFYASPRLLEVTGFAPGTTFAGRDDFIRRAPLQPEDREKWQQAVRALFASGDSRIAMELRVILRGETRWHRLDGLCFRNAAGQVVRWTGSTTDVTERHKVEDTLRSRQEMLDLAQKSARAIAFEWKLGTGEAFETWRELVHPEDRPAVKEAIRRARRTGEVAAEYRVVQPDGTHWLQATGRMFFDGGGTPTRIVGFLQDVTQRKHAEEELRQLEQKLRRAQRLEAMGTLAGGIAHDFNNILGAILGYGEMAMRDAKKGSRLRRDLDAIMAAGERGRGLVDRILAFSRSGVGERVAVPVEAVVREALDQLAAKLPENVTIVPRLHAARAAMLGDSTQVHQVVMNLANNAVQAMPAGGVLRVALDLERLEAPRAASIGTLSEGEYVVLRVSDTGGGIPAQVIERMFDPFFTTKDVGVGAGLGLSLVHGIVANVGGAIEIATELGKGTTFTVYLPRTGDAPAKSLDDIRPLPQGHGERVLVVDDEEPLASLVAETLERLGYVPEAFTSASAALAVFRADPGRFDAVLTDERMPGLCGSALIRELRGLRDEIPVVLMSGYVAIENVDADVVVRKPLSARELAAGVAGVLRTGAPS